LLGLIPKIKKKKTLITKSHSLAFLKQLIWKILFNN
jgi:hypothetical protein